MVNTSFLSSTISAIKSAHFGVSSKLSNIDSPGMIMLQAQVLLIENFNDQIRGVADKLKFLKKVTQEYKKNINHINTFLTSPTHESHHGKKPVIIASAGQSADLLQSLTTISYDLENKTMKHEGIVLNDLESKHSINNEDPENGSISTLELSEVCEDLSKIKDTKSYNEKANQIGDNAKLQLPMYFNESKSDIGIDGKKVLTFYTESVEKLLQVVENNMSLLQSEIDELTATLSDLSDKRKSAIEAANSTLNKINEAKNNTASKIGS